MLLAFDADIWNICLQNGQVVGKDSGMEERCPFMGSCGNRKGGSLRTWRRFV